MKSEKNIILTIDGFTILRRNNNYYVNGLTIEEDTPEEEYKTAEEAVDAFLLCRDLVK